MENAQKVSCNSSYGIITLPIEEYTRLVAESTINNIIRNYLSEEKRPGSSYVDGSFLCRVLGVDPNNKEE